MSKSILIIGGPGILSSAVVDKCIDQGFDVTMMNRGNNALYTNPNAKIIVCDARNIEQVCEKIKNLHFDVVVDFIVFTKDQLELSLSLFGDIAKQYVFISSAQVYNTTVKKILNENDDTPQPLWSYSVNKDICEKFLQSYCELNHINYTIVRPGVNYDNRRIPYGMSPAIGMHYTMVARILAGKPIVTWNGGNNKLNLTRVEDFASGIVGLLGNTKAYNNSFNVVGDFVYTWHQVLDIIGEVLGSRVKTVDIQLEKYASELALWDKEMLLGGRSFDLICSNDKLKSICPSFHSTIDLKTGVRKTLDWYKNNNYYKGFDYRWDAEQDRIINKYSAREHKLKYVEYSQTKPARRLLNYSIYQCSYYKNSTMKSIFWRVIRKILTIILK